jgi:hypothetical protein
MGTRILAIESHKIVVTLLSLSSFMYLPHIKLGSMLEKSKSCHHGVTFGCTTLAVDDVGIVITHQATLLTTADLAMAMVNRFTFVALVSLATAMHCKPTNRPFYYCILLNRKLATFDQASVLVATPQWSMWSLRMHA